MSLRSFQIGVASLAIAALALGAPQSARADQAAFTRNIAIGAGLAAIGIIIGRNVVHKHELATTVAGTTPDGLTVYADGRVVYPNGSSYYPGDRGQQIACRNMSCAIYNGNNPAYNGYYQYNGSAWAPPPAPAYQPQVYQPPVYAAPQPPPTYRYPVQQPVYQYPVQQPAYPYPQPQPYPYPAQQPGYQYDQSGYGCYGCGSRSQAYAQAYSSYYDAYKAYYKSYYDYYNSINAVNRGGVYPVGPYGPGPYGPGPYMRAPQGDYCCDPSYNPYMRPY
jgi:hypothetical protein